MSSPLINTMDLEKSHMVTRVLPVDPADIGEIVAAQGGRTNEKWIHDWELSLKDTPSAKHLLEAAKAIRESNVPVAFPTETVYGLGADATRDEAVKGIFRAKQRPADNPLIVHYSSLRQLRDFFQTRSSALDPIPSIYHPLIAKFWPGPLTILLPLPKPSPLAPSVNAGLGTFGARIPRDPIALSLIHLARRPIAAPSANASTRPSPTAAEHVEHDLNGKIEIVLDGGPSDVGVESTVVDGLVTPPVVLRPGGVSLEQLRSAPGWEDVRIAYKDRSEITDKETPRAPGMKYRHYSPKARVLLYEAGSVPTQEQVEKASTGSLGFVVTKAWKDAQLYTSSKSDLQGHLNGLDGVSRLAIVHPVANSTSLGSTNPFASLLTDLAPIPKAHLVTLTIPSSNAGKPVWVIELGADTKDIARGLFSALRELDRKDVHSIFVEGIDETEGDVAAAVMNRLRKAAEAEVR